jgi:hypothetical protein
VPIVRQREHDGVDVLAGHDFTVVVVGLAVLVLVSAVDRVERLLEVAFVDITGGDDLAVLLLEKFTGVTRPHHAPAEDGHGDFVRGRVLSEHAGRNNGGKADSGGRAANELTTGGDRDAFHGGGW